MTFGEKIQKLRKEAGLSQEELSYQLAYPDRLSANGNGIMAIRKQKRLSV